MPTAEATLTALEFDRVLTLIANEAKTPSGRQSVLDRRPLATVAACEAAQADLAEMVRLFHMDGLLPLAGLGDVSPLLDRETVLELDESWLVVRAVRATQAVRETLLRTDSYPRLSAIASGIADFGDFISRTNRYFTRDGKLREDASAELRSIRTRIQQKRGAIQRVLNDVMGRSADAVQEPLIVLRGDRYCIPIRSDHRNAVPGILHERSGSGASFFIEPIPAVELNNDLADLLIQEREEIARIVRQVSQLIADSHDDIAHSVATTGALDALQACALFHDATRSTRPAFSAERALQLIDGRHPLLDERLASQRADAFGERPEDRNVVPISIALDPGASALVISGPNAGGKTIALKTAGLLVAMATAGLPVPAAEGTIIPVVDALHVLIGDDQSVLEHLSTFSAYLVRLKRVLERATDRSLVLLDELGSGTDPEEGAALAAAVIEHLLECGSLLIATTHLSSLKSFAVEDQRIVNASMEFDAASGQPTYRMIAGIPGRSRAIDIAQMMGLPAAVIASARSRLGDRFAETDALLAQLQSRMSEVVSRQDELARLQQDLEVERKRAADAAAALEKERAKVGGAYREELERLRDDVGRQVTAEIRHLRDMDRSARASLNANDVVQAVTKPVERAIDFLPGEERPIRVGERAEHRKFKVKGSVVSLNGSKAVLDVSGRKMTVEVRDLVPVSGGEAPSPVRKRQGQPTTTSSDVVEISAELNLIGQRVDDAIEESDRFLDRALLEGKQAVRIIHGFGTGALRKAIRDHLRKHPAIRSWRPGAENEGGDGATVAVLDT